MLKTNPTRRLLDSRIRAMECLAFGQPAQQRENPVLTQLRTLREETQNKARLDYLNVQKNCLDTFRTLFQQISDLSYFADGAGKDIRILEEVSSSLLKLKTAVAEDLLDVKGETDEEKKGKPVLSMASTVGDEEFDTFCTNRGGKHFRALAAWTEEASSCDLRVVDENNGTFSAVDGGDAICGTFLVFEGEGCLFPDADKFEKAFAEI